nr:hypothetical protein [Synechococcus sp. Tobar12-5m-g]
MAEPISINRVSAPSVGVLARAAWADPAMSGTRPAPAANRNTPERRSSPF